MNETKAAYGERTIKFPGKNTIPLHGRLWIQVHSEILSIRHNPEFQKKLFDRVDTKEYQELRLFVRSVRQATTRI